jgi:hypothetical protein
MLIIRHQTAPVFPLSCAGNIVGGVLAPLLDMPDSMPCRAHDLVPDGLCDMPGAWHAPALCAADTTPVERVFAVPGSGQPTADMPGSFPVFSVLSGLIGAPRASCPVWCLGY